MLFNFRYKLVEEEKICHLNKHFVWYNGHFVFNSKSRIRKIGTIVEHRRKQNERCVKKKEKTHRQLQNTKFKLY